MTFRDPLYNFSIPLLNFSMPVRTVSLFPGGFSVSAAPDNRQRGSLLSTPGHSEEVDALRSSCRFEVFVAALVVSGRQWRFDCNAHRQRAGVWRGGGNSQSQREATDLRMIAVMYVRARGRSEIMFSCDLVKKKNETSVNEESQASTCVRSGFTLWCF